MSEIEQMEAETEIDLEAFNADEATEEELNLALEALKESPEEAENSEEQEDSEEESEEVESEEQEVEEEAENSEVGQLKSQLEEQQASIEALKEYADRMTRQLDQTATERKKLQDMLAEKEKAETVSLDELTNEDILDDPKAALQKLLSGKSDAPQGLTKEDVIDLVYGVLDTSRQQELVKTEVKSIVPNIEDLKEEMGEQLRLQGVNEATIENFKRDIWQVDRSYLQPIAIAAAKERELQELRSQVNNTGEEVVGKIKKAQVKHKSINAKGSKVSAETVKVRPEDIHNLPTEQLDQLLKSIKQER